MKKVLSAFFAVFLSTTGGYCENVSPINTGANLSDVMNAPVSIQAVYKEFIAPTSGSLFYPCYEMDTKIKNTIASLIAELTTQSKDITLGMIFTTCTNGYAEINNNTNYLKQCTECVIDIAKSHNDIIETKIREEQRQLRKEQEQEKEIEIERMKNTTVFTSEEEYNKVLKAKGLCTPKNSRWKLEFNRRVHTKHGCEKTCKDYAIANACLLDVITFDETCECCPESLSISTSAGFTPYYVRPTWEDYKKLYNIK